MYTHVPNILCFERICYNCVGKLASDYHCCVCAPRQHTYVGLNWVNDFLNEILHQPRQVVFGHNSSAYDSMFIVRALLDMMANTDFSIVLNGYKVLILTVMAVISFKDMLSYILLRLSLFNRTFRVEKNSRYPYLFNQEANLHFKGLINHSSYFMDERYNT